ncbi:hypothetical protein O181_099804 [Austropuccinia psidii MF-1]|uniref:Uncharacterized protein n=1 Tax=Austropuccinia psidii MF-1 TaxID=1389203 RepID=A0A9Q3PFT3_9BASI|nr:hypothetical protein [Austropuccinia psidii MF-1]
MPTNPKCPKTTSGPKLTKDHLWAILQPIASGNHQRPPAQLQEEIPLIFRGRPFLSQCTPYSRIQEWCIYCIIYHYAPFLLRKSNGDIFRPQLHDYKSSTQSIINFKGGSFSYFSLEIPWQLPEDHLRIPTTWPCRGWVVISHQDYSKGNSQRL